MAPNNRDYMRWICHGALINCCALCVDPSCPLQWGPDLPFVGEASHAYPLDGWHCSSGKQAMLILIQVRKPNASKSEFADIDKVQYD